MAVWPSISCFDRGLGFAGSRRFNLSSLWGMAERNSHAGSVLYQPSDQEMLLIAEENRHTMQTRTISMLLGAVLATGAALAQAPDQNQPSSAAQAAQATKAHEHKAPDPDRMAKHLGKKLNLSNDQVAQIKPVLEDRAQQMQALRADTSLSQQDRRNKAHQVMQDSNSKIEAVLNDTQKQQFEQMLQERRDHRKSQTSAQ